jgi:hypothetical protein
MLIIGVTGKKRSGKDTFFEAVRQEYGICKTHSYSFATPVYEMVNTLLCNVPGGAGTLDKEDIIQPFGVSLRHMLQTLGTEWGRNLVHPDIWAMLGRMYLDKVSYPVNSRPSIFVFTDVRFDNEAKMIKNCGGYIVHVSRFSGSVPVDADLHASEAGINFSYVDVTILNHGNDVNIYKRKVLQTVADLMRREKEKRDAENQKQG